VFGIFGGVTADNIDRKAIIIVASLCWSTCTLLSGTIVRFWVFFFMRVLLGFFQAFMNPTAYSMIADYFPADKRTRASSIFNLAIYLGGAMAAISSILITRLGWRSCYAIVAAIGLAFSVLGVFAIYNPPRGRWEEKKELSAGAQQLNTARRSTLEKFLAALREIFRNPTCRWVAVGGFFRFFGGFSIAFFLPRYFRLIWPGPEFVDAYAVC
jgi:MFS family permease